jgi:hypothetical protein
MNKREKMLAVGCGLMALVVILGLAVHRLFILPAADCRVQAAKLVDDIQKAKALKAKEPEYQARLLTLAGHTFGDDEMRVSEQVRTTVTSLLTLSGLSTQNLSLKPLLGTRVPNAYREIGWAVRARGKLESIVNFLYLMTKEVHLHRVDNVVLTPAPGGEIDLQVKYATLLLESPKELKDEKLQSNTVANIVLEADVLESAERREYDLISERDLFRPFIQRRQPPPTAVASGNSGGSRPETRPAGDRVVGLPTWDGTAEVVVVNTGSGKITTYKRGDELAGGKIVLVDYRPLPMPKNPELLSSSRVVIRIGSEYYAVELGQVLTEKRPLAPAEWPPGLPKLQTVDTGPAPAADGNAQN